MCSCERDHSSWCPCCCGRPSLTAGSLVRTEPKRSRGRALRHGNASLFPLFAADKMKIYAVFRSRGDGGLEILDGGPAARNVVFFILHSAAERLTLPKHTPPTLNSEVHSVAPNFSSVANSFRSRFVGRRAETLPSERERGEQIRDRTAKQSARIAAVG